MQSPLRQLVPQRQRPCDVEPIYIPGLVQPHGLLPLFDAASEKLAHWRDFVPAAVLMTVITFGVFAATLWPAGDQDQYAVVAPPSYNLGRTIGLVRVAGGVIVEVGGLKNVVIVHSANKNFVAALYRAGAWLVFNPQKLRGCIGFHKNPKLPGAFS